MSIMSIKIIDTTTGIEGYTDTTRSAGDYIANMSIASGESITALKKDLTIDGVDHEELKQIYIDASYLRNQKMQARRLTK